MKISLILILILTSLSSYADFMAERDAVTKFENEEFLNDSNYPPTKPGQVKQINKAFADKLEKDPVKLKYFVFLGIKYRLLNQYNSDRAFALALESKFNGSKLDDEKKVKLIRAAGQLVFDDKTAEHKTALKSKQSSDDYYNKIIGKLMKTPIK